MPDESSLLAERIRQLARSIPAAVAGGFAVAALTVVSLWSDLPHRWIIEWVAAIVLLSAVRLTLFWACRNVDAGDAGALRRWLLAMRAAAFAAGLSWGAVALFSLGPHGAPLDFLSYLVAGITAAATAALAADRRAAQLFQWSAILPLVARLLTTGEAHHLPMALMGLMYGSYLAIAASRAHAQFSKTTALKLHALRQQRKLRGSERRYRSLAHRDPLTDLPNRLALEARLPALLARAARTGRTLALLYIDLDNFKDVNDSHGHRFGDQVLIEVSRRLRGSAAPGDLVVRMGGDEFVVVTARTRDRGDVERLARRICTDFRVPLALDGQNCLMPVSIGIALCPGDGGDSGFLMRAADLALYDVKARGRNGYEFFRAEMTRRLEERVFLAEALRAAVGSDQFHMEYQPVVDLASGRVISFEALLRWRHPQRGLIPPGDFIPVAEQSGFIDAIGEQAIRLVCRQLRAWRDALVPLVPVAVNVSARQLERRGFVDRLTRIAAEHDVDPCLLRVEITESALMAHGEAPTEAMLAMQRLGVKIAIDDFGTGYCQLDYLKRLPIDCLKIDRGFIRDMERDARSNTLLGAIIAIGRSFSITVVAEGVETAQQAELLRKLGCECAQGYYFHRPAGPERSRELLEREGGRHLDTETFRLRTLPWRGAAAS